MGRNLQVGHGTSQVGGENAICKSIITVMTSVSLPT